MMRLNKPPIALISSILIVAFMLWAAEWMKQPEIIFPEISALAMGSFVFREKNWIYNPLHIWLAPTLAAGIGVGINFLTIQPVWKEILCLIVIVLFIKWLKVRVGPVISAGLLPVVLGVTSWLFVLSVCLLTFVIMLGIRLNKQSAFIEENIREKKRYSFIYLIIMMIWIMVCNLFNLNHWLIPPIFVVAYEMLHRESVTYSVGMKQVVLLALAAIVGSVLYDFMPHMNVLFGISDLLIVFVLSRILKFHLSPAFAVSLLPLILPKFVVWEYPLIVFLASFLLLFTMIFYRKTERTFQNRLDSMEKRRN